MASPAHRRRGQRTYLGRSTVQDAYWQMATGQRPTSKQEVDHIYFIQAEEGGPVKIGRAKNPTKRLSTLQIARIDRLVLRRVVPVHNTKSSLMERRLHEHFAHLRVSGEWFELDDELRRLAHAI